MEHTEKSLNDRITVIEVALLDHMKAQEKHWEADNAWKIAQTKEMNSLMALKNKWGGIIIGISIAASALYGAFTLFSSISKSLGA